MSPTAEVLAALGLLPAIPLVGHAALERTAPGLLRVPLPAAASLVLAAGLALWSLLLFIAPITIYRPWLVGLVGWAVTVALGIPLLSKRRPSYARPKRIRPEEVVLLAVLLGAGLLYIAFPTESIYADRDEGIYSIRAIYLAHHGSLTVPYPWSPQDDQLLRAVYRPPSGLYPTEPEMQMQFGHLFPVWLAQAYAVGGSAALFRLNGLFAILAAGIFYVFVRSLVPRRLAVAAVAFLAFNPSQLWVARVTLTETLTQLLIVAAITLLLLALRADKPAWARWSGLFLGLAAVVRIDGLFLLPLLLLAHLADRLVRGAPYSNRVWAQLYLVSVPLFAAAVAAYATLSRIYFRDLAGQVLGIGALAIVAAAALLLSFTPVRRALRSLVRGRGAAVIWVSALLGSLAYGYWIRPQSPVFSSADPSRRTYAELSLVNLAAYLSPAAIALAAAGGALALVRGLLSRRAWWLLIPLILIGGFAALYLWNPSIAPRHFWTIRRFVPMVIPGFVAFAALGLHWAISQVPRATRTLALAGVVLGAAAFTLVAGWRLYGFAEHRGLYSQVQALAGRLPADRVVLADGYGSWTMPLHLAFDRRIVRVNLRQGQTRRVALAWAQREREAGRDVTLLVQGSIPPLDPGAQVIDSIVLRRELSERTVHPLPDAVEVEELSIFVLRLPALAPATATEGRVRPVAILRR